jgi:glycosyltransferase involved in cell wall biosynthesis
MLPNLPVTVLMTAYNCGMYIEKSINSILNQTYQNFELIIVNDGSKDNSLNVVNSISDSRITLINKTNGGVSSARNVGIKTAKGKYISLLDADDMWDVNYLVVMKKLIEDFPEASFYGCQFYCKNGNDIKISNQVHDQRGYIDNYFKAQIKAPVVWSSSVIIKKECFEQIGFFNTKLLRGEDLEMWVRLARNYKLAFEPVPLSYYMIDARNRACYTTPPLENRYLQYKLNKLPYYERKYFLKLAKDVIIELLFKKKFKEVFYLIGKFKLFIMYMIFES